MRFNAFSIAIKILLVAAAVIFYFTIWPWIMIYFGNFLLPNPPKTQITYGEFPFKLVYEIDGERKVIEDTLICEYDGLGMDEGQGKFRKWKERLASGNNNILLLKVDNPIAIGSDENVVEQEIYYNPGSSDYYMGDMGEGVIYKHNFRDACYFEKYLDGSSSDGIIFADELYEKYKIKIISWDYTPPIQNSFS